MTEMTERLKPLGEMFGLPQDFNEDTKDKVTELKISHLKDYHKGNLGETGFRRSCRICKNKWDHSAFSCSST